MNRRDELEKMKKMEIALDYMQENIRSKLSLKEVARIEELNHNPTYFADIFREYFEMSWKDYYISLKMRAAARAIRRERLCVNVSKQFGYSDYKSFIQSFKREIGMNPADFLKDSGRIPDMPDRKQLCGVEIRTELVRRGDISISGIALYPSEPDTDFDRLGDAAHALTCIPEWESKLNGPPYVGIWTYDETGNMFYCIGSLTENRKGIPVENNDGLMTGIDDLLLTDNQEENLAGHIRQDIGGGQYVVFSSARTGDAGKDVQISRMLARYAMKEWRRVNHKDTNRQGYTYEVFDEERLYLYLPLLGDFGDNDHWISSMNASLFREYIDRHITEEIRINQYAKENHYTERWLRDSFRNVFGMTPGRYMDVRRLKLAAKEITAHWDNRQEILQRYHFSSMSPFAKQFYNYYGISYKDFREPEFTLPESITLYPGTYNPGPGRQVRVYEVSLPPLRTALHPLTMYPEFTEVSDYPGLVTFWFTHDWTWNDKGYNLKSTGEIDRIFLYDVHLFEMNKMERPRYPIGMVLEEMERGFGQTGEGSSARTKKEDKPPQIPKGYRERVLEGGRYICFEPEDSCGSGNLLELYQQMESGIFLKWYYENQMIISTTKEKIIRYKNGKLSFYLPLEV